MRSFYVTLFAVAAVKAFPYALQADVHAKSRRDLLETNCGQIPCTTFDAPSQLVDVSPSSANPFIAPGEGDLRGPCPGLNAAANHAFLPRNGIPSILQTITGLGQAFAIGPDLTGFLAAYAVALGGDPLTETWSIGGSYSGSAPLLTGNPQGISYSHNNYESDSSVARYDAYMNNGDASTLVMSKFEHLYSSADSFTLSTLQDQFKYNQDLSIAENPYYFSAPFSGVLVAPAAHNFIINLMSNHSAETPSGYLDGDTLKSFFGITGSPGSFAWSPGSERIPDNWYRRPTIDAYTIPRANADVLALFSRYPDTIRIGGNTGTPNSYVGVGISELTGDSFDNTTLLQGNNLGCFAFQAASAGLPDALQGLVSNLGPVTALLSKYFNPVMQALECPQLAQYNQDMFSQFPGYGYHPSG